MAEIESILIANRGEIAVRIIRTARKLGYRTIAVYSSADARAPHVKLADHAVLLGDAPVSDSYLNQERILEAAAQSGADAIHPGYGFLSENAGFAKACADRGLIFIGPSFEAIEKMGNKAEAKRLMIAAGVPCVPGYEGQDQSDAAFLAAAERIGFPLMVKAAAGGGGRGMRLVHGGEDLASALQTARSEARNAFGSDELILERAIVNPRHVEFQVFGDRHGHIIHMGERDCSVQRRHQKVIEEAPCPVMTPDLRERMGQAAVDAARTIDYTGAGTVEFLLGQDGAFYFLEMNTRLQVEHPVTEMVTGLDLVALQIQVARGEPLGLSQNDVRLSGHAIEVRLYAEDPDMDFLPSTGTVDLWMPPMGAHIRVDDGIESGQTVSPFYDPMIAKIIAHGPSRDVTRRSLIAALNQTAVFGLRTNRQFLAACLDHALFADGAATTGFIAEAKNALLPSGQSVDVAHVAVAAVLQDRGRRDRAYERSLSISPELLNWSSAGRLRSSYRYDVSGHAVNLIVQPFTDTLYHVMIGQETIDVDILALVDPKARVCVAGKRENVLFHHVSSAQIHCQMRGRSLFLADHLMQGPQAEDAARSGRITAPMHGRVLDVFVSAGQEVAEGERLAVLEAMKMQHEILAPVGGMVSAVHAKPDAQVAADDVLLEIDDPVTE